MIEFEQRMFDIIATQNVAAAALNCMEVAKDYAKACALPPVSGNEVALRQAFFAGAESRNEEYQTETVEQSWRRWRNDS